MMRSAHISQQVAVALLLMGLTGCRVPLRPIFAAYDPPIVWPKAPDRPRIRYIGELTGEASLAARPSGWAAFRAALTGVAPTVAFSTPTAVEIVGERVYVVDRDRRAVFVLDLTARTFDSITTAAGLPFEWLSDIAEVDGMIAVSDSRRGAVFLFDADGQFVRTIGEGLLERPTGIAWLDAAGELWVLDTAVHACLVFGIDGTLRRSIGRRGVAAGEFNSPTGLAHAASVGTVVADSMNFRIQLFDAEDRSRLVFGRKGDAAGDFALPRDVAVDSDGHIYVLDNRFENVQVFDRHGALLMAFGGEGDGPGEFALPSGITIDHRDRIWIADTYNRRVQVFQYLRENEQ